MRGEPPARKGTRRARCRGDDCARRRGPAALSPRRPGTAGHRRRPLDRRGRHRLPIHRARLPRGRHADHQCRRCTHAVIDPRRSAGCRDGGAGPRRADRGDRRRRGAGRGRSGGPDLAGRRREGTRLPPSAHRPRRRHDATNSPEQRPPRHPASNSRGPSPRSRRSTEWRFRRARAPERRRPTAATRRSAASC